MALFVVRHWHAAHRCPAADPEMGARFLNLLSPSQARQHGVELHGEAIIQGEHTLYLIAEASDEACVREFLRPFAMAGSVEISTASTCADVVASGGCAATSLAIEADGAVMQPEGACQRALDAGLVLHRAHPLNCETSIPALIGGVVMPSAHYYVRNHFHIPLLDPAAWRLRVHGSVERPNELSLRDLHQLRSHTVVVTMECAGNGRSLLEPPVDGEQWGFGAVSTAEWTGVPLVEVLDRAGVDASAREVLFRGADRGRVDGHADPIHFERSLSVDVARDPEVLLAYAMNGEPLPARHGAPVRLVVPGWYGVASVKWLTDVEAIPSPFEGYYQTEKYVYEWPDDGRREPVTLQRVRSLVTEPARGEVLRRGEVTVRGVAWSGAAMLASVQVSVGGGPWQEARLVDRRLRHSWQWWELTTRIDEAGPTTIRARANDLAGRTQPERPQWNTMGYGSNAIHTVPLSVE